MSKEGEGDPSRTSIWLSVVLIERDTSHALLSHSEITDSRLDRSTLSGNRPPRQSSEIAERRRRRRELSPGQFPLLSNRVSCTSPNGASPHCSAEIQTCLRRRSETSANVVGLVFRKAGVDTHKNITSRLPGRKLLEHRLLTMCLSVINIK